jgi:hypothetical protein
MTREEIRQSVENSLQAAAAAQERAVRRSQLVRRTTLLSLLCFSVLQFYFLSLGVELLSMPRLTVFVPPVLG